jgi:protein SCO1/2
MSAALAPPAPVLPLYRRRLAVGLAALLVFAGAAGLLAARRFGRAAAGTQGWSSLRPRTEPPYPLPNFSLQDRQGHRVAREELLGHAWVADVLFLECGDLCTRLNQKMGELQRQTQGRDLRFVSFSVGPDDGPEALSRYLRSKRYLRGDRRPDPRWLLLAAAPDSTPRLLSALGLGQQGEQLAVSQWFFLVDKTGTVRGLYDGLDAGDNQRLLRDLLALDAAP